MEIQGLARYLAVMCAFRMFWFKFRLSLCLVLLSLFPSIALTETLQIHVKEVCSPTTDEIELIALNDTDDLSTTKFCIQAQHSITNQDIQSVLEFAPPTEGEMGDVEYEFARLRKMLDLDKVSDESSISYSKFTIIFSESGAASFRKSVNSGKTLILAHGQTLLGEMNFDSEPREGDSIVIFSDTLTVKGEEMLRDHAVRIE